jgi:outer membrane protein OmpA-like peptidoglycan-associated protein
MTMRSNGSRAAVCLGVLLLGVTVMLDASAARAQSVNEFLRMILPPGNAPAAAPAPPTSGPASPFGRAMRLEEVVAPAPAPAIAETTVAPSPPEPPRPPNSTREIRFRFGSAELDERWIENVRNFATALNHPSAQGQRVLIVGHTDAVGNDQTNLELSRRRAAAVRDFLVTQGRVSPDRIFVDGRGRSQLARPDAPDHEENRRVEIIRIARE